MSSHKGILFSANDPGGANAILPVVRALAERGDSVRGIATGPALEQFRAVGVPVEDGGTYQDADLQRAIESIKPDLFLAGSSIGATIDKKIFRMLGKVPSVYVIDFWSHYAHRFVEPQSDLVHMPTKICVIDERMRDEVAKEGFPEDRIAITGNPHFDHFTEGIMREGEDKKRVVFISQPIREDVAASGAPDCGFDEFTALEDLIKVLPSDLSLSIRFHPRDDIRKFDVYITDRISIAREHTLVKALSHSGLVVGMFSPVLMQAALAGKPTISYQPHLIGEDRLPTNVQGITHAARSLEDLRTLLGSYQAGTLAQHAPNAKSFFPKGATERVITTIDSLV